MGAQGQPPYRRGVAAGLLAVYIGFLQLQRTSVLSFIALSGTQFGARFMCVQCLQEAAH